MPSFAAFGNDLYTGRRSIDFVGRRRLWYTIAAVLMLISLAAVGLRGLNPGIEFRGGTEFRINGTSISSDLVGKDAVTSVVPQSQPLVTQVGDKGIRVQADQITDADLPKVSAALAKAYKVPATAVSTNFVGPTWGADVTRQAITGLFVFLALVAAVIALYFRTWKMAAAALVALLHDLILTVGVYALVGFEVTPASVIGFLTILGYSLYDTVVVFDKLRENTEHITATTRRTFGEAANLAVNQTLVRSINTSVVALLPVGSILFIGAFLLGAGTLKDIALSLFVGIAAGTYSSIFIATPLLVKLRENEPELRGQAQRVLRRRAEAAAGGAGTADDAAGELAAVGSAGGASGAPGSTAFANVSTGERAAQLRPATGGQRQQPRKAGTPRGGRPGSRKR
jgi:preprotein translocase subunit SecF